MLRAARTTTIALLGVAAAVIAFLVLAMNDVFVREIWTRDSPLINPITVTGVQDGVLKLSNGRSYQPSGVRRRDDITPAQYDQFIRAAAEQGVVVIRDTGNNRALLMAEPKFYNWCGTHGMWSHWAGTYTQCALSEFLVFARYAQPIPGDPACTAYERWRIDGAQHLDNNDTPMELSSNGTTIRYNAALFAFKDYDELLGLAWKPPPAK